MTRIIIIVAHGLVIALKHDSNSNNHAVLDIVTNGEYYISLEVTRPRLEVLRSVMSDIMFRTTIKGCFGRKFSWRIE